MQDIIAHYRLHSLHILDGDRRHMHDIVLKKIQAKEFSYVKLCQAKLNYVTLRSMKLHKVMLRQVKLNNVTLS